MRHIPATLWVRHYSENRVRFIPVATLKARRIAPQTAPSAPRFKAISEGEREFSKIAIVGGKNGNVTDMFMPCGVCRQVMAEFCDEDFEIIVALTHDDFKSFTLKELLPFGFSKNNIVVD